MTMAKLPNKRLKRTFEIKARSMENVENEELWVEGYAVVFNSPTVLFEESGEEYNEVIAFGALDSAKMDDVIFNYNHSGKVLARTRNKTLILEIDEHGLKIYARLDGTAEGREMYEEINKGYVDRMSFTFTVDEEENDYNPAKRLWTVKKIKRLYDVSAVDIPAYDDTSIEARKAVALAAKAQQQRQRMELRLAARMLAIKIKTSKNN